MLKSGVQQSNDTNDHSCFGSIISSDDLGHCMCPCAQYVHEYVPTAIGEIVGLHITPRAILCYTLFVLVGLLAIFEMMYPLLERSIHILKRSLVLFKRIPNIGDFLFRFLSAVSVPSSGFVIIFGLFIGGFLRAVGLEKSLSGNELLFFDHEVLFLFLIPPLIFYTGFYLHVGVFLRHAEIILTHAVLGTLLNMVLLGLSLYLVFQKSYDVLDCFVFSSLISAIDPVAVITIFHQKKVNARIDTMLEGESILNDAVAIVFFSCLKAVKVSEDAGVQVTLWVLLGLAVVKFVWVVAIALTVGVGCGIMASFLLRFIRQVHELEIYELLLPLFFGMLSYFLAESLYSSGIVAIMVSAVFMSQYLKFRLTSANRVTLKNGLALAARVCEGLIFLYLGMAVVLFEHEWDWGLVLFANVLIFMYRFAIVFLISIVFNVGRAWTKKKMVPWKEVFVQAFSGIRGAVSFALVWTVPNTIASRGVMVTTTVTVIAFTIFLQSSLISSLVYALRIEKKKLPVEKKVAQFRRMNRHLKKIIICLPVEHAGEAAKLDEAFRMGGVETKRLLARNTAINYSKLRKVVGEAVEIRIGEHAYHVLQEKGEFRLKAVDDIYKEDPDELEIIRELFFFLRLNANTFAFPKNRTLNDSAINAAAKLIHDLVLFKDRISFLIAKLLQAEFESKMKMEQEYSKWFVSIVKRFDRVVQWVLNRRGVVKEDKKFIRAYFDFKSYADLHMFEHIATKKADSIASGDDSPTSSVVSQPQSLTGVVRSRTFKSLKEEHERRRRFDQRTKRVKDIRGEIALLGKELEGLNTFFTDGGIPSPSPSPSILGQAGRVFDNENIEVNLAATLSDVSRSRSVDDINFKAATSSIARFSDGYFGNKT